MKCSRRRFLRIAATAATGATFASPVLRAFSQWTDQTIRWHGIALGAEASIQIEGLASETAKRLLADCRAELVRLESIFSLYDGRSALAHLNRTGVLQAPPPELIALLTHAHRLSEETSGAFDVSVQPLCELFARPRPEVTATEISHARSLVDFHAIEVTPDCIRLARPGMKLTLNGLAQGYITDCIAEKLRAGGCQHTLVDLGEKRALGPHHDGNPWRLSVECPVDRTRLVGVLELQHQALATSGGYGTPWPHGRHHLIDARLGENRTGGWASVSVLAPTATEADGLSTALAVLSESEAKTLLARHQGCTAYVVQQENQAQLAPLVCRTVKSG